MFCSIERASGSRAMCGASHLWDATKCLHFSSREQVSMLCRNVHISMIFIRPRGSVSFRSVLIRQRTVARCMAHCCRFFISLFATMSKTQTNQKLVCEKCDLWLHVHYVDVRVWAQVFVFQQVAGWKRAFWKVGTRRTISMFVLHSTNLVCDCLSRCRGFVRLPHVLYCYFGCHVNSPSCREKKTMTLHFLACDIVVKKL